jgi:hypothetical protein
VPDGAVGKEETAPFSFDTGTLQALSNGDMFCVNHNSPEQIDPHLSGICELYLEK